MQDIENFCQYASPVRALFGQVANGLDQPARVTLQQGLQHAIHLTVVEGAEHGAHIGGQYLALTEGDGLIGEAHGIAHRTIGRATQQPQRIFFKGYLFDTQYMGQVLDHPLRRHVLQGELQAAREDSHRQLLRIGGSQQELDVGWRLFEGFQQGVERVRRQHVHFVDQVDLEAPAAWGVLHVVEQLTGVFDLGAAGGIDFDQVDKTTFIDLLADRAHTAGRGADAGFAVQALGDDPRNGGLAHPTGTGKQIGVVQPLAVERVDQGLEHMGLADHFAERARTPFTCKNLITHRKPSRQGG